MSLPVQLKIALLRILYALTGYWPRARVRYTSLLRLFEMLRRAKSPRVRTANALAARRLVLATALVQAKREDEAAQFALSTNQVELTNAFATMAQAALATNSRSRAHIKRQYRTKLRAARADARREAFARAEAKRELVRAEVMAERQELRARQMVEQEELREEIRTRVAAERLQQREEARKKAIDAARARAEARRKERILLNPDLLLSPSQRKARRWQQHVQEEFHSAINRLRAARPQTDATHRKYLDEPFLNELQHIAALRGQNLPAHTAPGSSHATDDFDDDMIDADTKALLESYEEQLNQDLEQIRAQAAQRQKRQQAARRRVELRRKQEEEERQLAAGILDAADPVAEAQIGDEENENDDGFLRDIESSLTTRLDQTAAPAPKPKPRPKPKPLIENDDLETEFELPEIGDTPEFLAEPVARTASRQIRDELESETDLFIDLTAQDDLLPDLPAARPARRANRSTDSQGPDRATLRLRRRVRLPRTKPELKLVITEELEMRNHARVIELLEGAAIQNRLDPGSIRYWLNCALEATAHEVTAYLLLQGIAHAIKAGRWRRVGELIWMAQSVDQAPTYTQLQPHFYQANESLHELAIVILAASLGTKDQLHNALAQPEATDLAAAHDILPNIDSKAQRPVLLLLGEMQAHAGAEFILQRERIEPEQTIRLTQQIQSATQYGDDDTDTDPALANGLTRWLQEILFQLEADPALDRLAKPFGTVAANRLGLASGALNQIARQINDSECDQVIIWPSHHPQAAIVAAWLREACANKPTTLAGLLPAQARRIAHSREPGHRQTGQAREAFDRFMRGLWKPLPLPPNPDARIYVLPENEEPAGEKTYAITDPDLAPEYFENALDWRTEAPRRADRASEWLTYLQANLTVEMWNQLSSDPNIVWAAQLSPVVDQLINKDLPRAARLIARSNGALTHPLVMAEAPSPFELMLQAALGDDSSAVDPIDPIRAYLNMRHKIDGKLAILVPDPRDHDANKLAKSLQRAIGDTQGLQVAVQFLPNDPRHGRFNKADTFADLPVLHNLSMIDSLKAADFVVTPVSTTATSCALMGLNVLYVNDDSEIERDRQRVFETVKVTKPRGLRVALRNMMAAND